MIRQWLRKRAKIGYGFLNTYLMRRGHQYDDRSWWDKSFYTGGVSDRQTIAQQRSVVAAKYHYASMEMQILRHLRNNNLSVDSCSVMDIGSGSGHWIDFYKSLDAGSVVGMDVSSSSCSHLRQKYAGDSGVEIHHGKALEVIDGLNGEHDIVNAIGVMFHIVDDAEWRDTVAAIGRVVKKGGLFIIGGHFGLLDGLNVQIDKDGNINKRLRSKRHWRSTLREAGFKDIQFYHNNAYLWIDEPLPENNVLIARK